MRYARSASAGASGVRASVELSRGKILVTTLSVGLLLAASGVAEGEAPAVETTLVRAPTAKTTLVSVSSNGRQGDNVSSSAEVSAHGRYVAFSSAASTLVRDDTNPGLDVFVHDRRTGITTRVSVRSNGNQANGSSTEPSISADGRYVAFYSYAPNLVPGDTNDAADVFVHDRQTGKTTRVSLRSNGNQANRDSVAPSISAGGRFIAFNSAASNLVPGDTNGAPDVFVHDRRTGKTARVSLRSNGSQGNRDSSVPSISGQGRYVAFYSKASNLVRGDTNGKYDAFVHDRRTGKTTRVSVRSNGNQTNGQVWSVSISGNGRYVAFDSNASNLVRKDTNNKFDAFVHDRRTGVTRRVSVSSSENQANRSSHFPVMSGNGRYVAFLSSASDLARGDTNGKFDAFVRDRQTGTTRRVSVSSNGDQGNRASGWPAISADGRYVVFQSVASNLVHGDRNNMYDLFARGPLH
jgi:Tol biopolymer transport system component